MITLFLNKTVESLKKTKEYKLLLEKFAKREFPVVLESLRGVILSGIAWELQKTSNSRFIFVFPTDLAAKTFCSDYSLWGGNIFHLPSWETSPYSGDTPSSYISGMRINAITEFLKSETAAIAMGQRAFLTSIAPKDFIKSFFITFKKGSEIVPAQIEEKLQQAGYLRVPRVGIHGEFAMRGEVLDIFMPGTEEAVRIVFDFDTIENIKLFDPAGQHSTSTLEEITICPNREIIWTDNIINQAFEKNLITEDEKDQLFQMRTIKGEEYIFPLSFGKDSCNIADLCIPDGKQQESTLFLVESELLETGYEALDKEFKELYKRGTLNRTEASCYSVTPEMILPSWEKLLEKKRRKVFLPIIGKSSSHSIRFNYEPGRSFFGNFNYLREELEKLVESGYSVSIFSSSDSQRIRIEHILKDLNINVILGFISSGFVLPSAKIIAIQENEIFGRKKRTPLSVKKAKSQAIDSFVELSPGDYVVHVNYGIGRFLGIDRIKAAKTERDYIHLEYADDEKIFIPIEQVNLVQRYIGSEGSAPHLDRLGGKSWEARKSKVKKAAEDIAEKLVTIYSKRKYAQGFAFPKDTPWQEEFEASFPYEETADQLTSIEEVKADMEKPTPMDRLLCGDVGYGKTEVAMRVAFKAVSGGKQVAYLAPTTILTDQHYGNFKERFANYPVNIAMLSRFVSNKDQKKVLEGLENGNIDLVIGTHRLLQKDVKFKNLGLMITDEEQRFGVKDKERMKEFKSSVDCLALSATPIPRTLHMSLLKIRDMSVLKTPPHNRRPIETFVEEFKEETVLRAIQREIERGGQIYYLHNRVESLENVKLFLQKLAPEILVETAHGRMNGTEIEDVMHRFINRDFHVLVSTTIIENGLDIPNVNTIIIDRADLFGISQLYQLRGRVGRSDRLAYAYLLYPERRALTELAMKRLQIISDNTELGSGFKIALKDLEVRGAGNLLGREQSGEIASVGFDMYLRLIDEAVRALERKHGTVPEEAPDVYLELEYSGYIPDSYIKDQLEKMEVYKGIVSISTEEELDRLYSELEDRFGHLPDEVESLMSIAEIKIICKKFYISSVKERKGILEIEFAKVSLISADKVISIITESRGKVKLDPYRPNVLLIQTDVIGLKEKSAFLREKLMRFL